MSDVLQKLKESSERSRPFVLANIEKDIFKLQYILGCKSDWSGVLETLGDEYYYVRHGDKFGLSEMMVNQLMTLAYNKGRNDAKEPHYDAGYNKAMQDVAHKLGFSNEHD